MKIAVLSPKKYEEAETFIQNHIKNLPFETVVIYGGGFPYISENYNPSNWDRRFHTLKRKFKLTSKTFKESQLIKILKKEKVEVVFAEYLITGAETVAICKKLKIPLIAIALGYEISMYHLIERYDKKYRKLFQYAKNILVVSEHMRLNIEKLDCPPEKIIYSPAGPTSSFFDIHPKYTNNQIVAIGRFVDKKAPHLTILAFHKVLEKVPTANLIMAGDGYLLNACKDLVKALNIENKVDFVGRINRDQHKKLLENSMLFIQHSKTAENGDSEGTPVAILEASAAGIPVVSTIHAGIPDTVLEGKTGFLVPEDDYKLMAKKMIYLLNNPNKIIEFGKTGKKFVQGNFSLKRHIDVLQKVIKKAI